LKLEEITHMVEKTNACVDIDILGYTTSRMAVKIQKDLNICFIGFPCYATLASCRHE